MYECCLLNSVDHSNAPEKLKNKTVRIGRLFGGQCVCLWDALHIEMLVKVPATDSEAYELEQLKARNKELWHVIEKIGLETVRREIKFQWFDTIPDSNPIRPEQLIPPMKVSVEGIGNWQG